MNQVHRVDLTDGAGHGMIVATPNVFLSIDSNNTADTNAVNCRMGYRFKNVGLQEYVGLAIQFGQ